MGYNTTVVIMNDALEAIGKDPEFGKNLKQAVLRAVSAKECPVRVGSLGHSTAAKVIETHHADVDVLIRVGGNQGIVVENTTTETQDDAIIGVTDVAEAMSVSLQTVRNWISSGRLNAEMVSGRWVIRLSDFNNMVK